MAQPPQGARQHGGIGIRREICDALALRLGGDLGEAAHRFADLVLQAQVLQRARRVRQIPR